MYKQHKYIETPPLDTKIWRYLDLTKLMSIFERQELFFSRADKFSDPYEGVMTKPAREEMKRLHGWTWDKGFKENKKKFCLNCWHINQFESDSMWKLYSASNMGLAIQSSIKSFIKSINIEDRFDVYLGKIDYLNYEADIFDYGNLFRYFLIKRKSFEHEKEVRALVNLGISNPKYGANEFVFIDGFD